MKFVIAMATTVVAAAGTLAAAEPHSFPAYFRSGGTRFKLRGQAPLKARVFFTVCDVALYLPPDIPKSDLFTDVPKALELAYNYDITADQFAKSADHALKRNLSPAQLAAIAPQVARINSLYRNVEKGDRYRLVSIPGNGSTLTLNGKPLGTIPGKEFGKQYFKIWLGSKPLDKHARDQLLRPDRVEKIANPTKEPPMTRTTPSNAPSSVHDFTIKDARNNDVPLSSFKGKTLLIVNVASKCGFTEQYEGLQELYEKFRDRGLVVLGFPCNQFGSQEPGTNQEIQEFCKMNFGVTFPVFGKIDVNGDNAHPLYIFLKKEAPGLFGTQAIKWNFTKFLVDPDGNVIKRYGSKTKPSGLVEDIEEFLGEA